MTALCRYPVESQGPVVHALAVCKVVAAGDFVSFFNLREGAPNLNGVIMGGFPLSLYAETLPKFEGTASVP